MCAIDENSIVLQKPIKQTRFLSYGKEITIALLVKFLLLGGLWWLFFAGNKHTIDAPIMAKQIFGGQQPNSISHQNQGNPQ